MPLSRNRRIAASSHELEPRAMLAGNVFAFAGFSDLRLIGFHGEVDIAIESTEEGIVVRGESGTRINNSTDPFLAFPGQTEIPDDLRIFMFRGDATVSIEGVVVADDLTIVSSRGNDLVTLNGVTVGGTANIITGSGEDTITIDGNPSQDFDNASIGGLRISTGWGNDNIGVSNLAVKEDLTINSSLGNDRIAISNTLVGDDLNVYASSGDDLVGITNSRVEDRTTLNSGSGDDRVGVRNSVHVGNVSVAAGWGDDFVAIQGSDLGRVRASLSIGDDLLSIDAESSFSSNFGGFVSVNGGSGDDVVEVADLGVFAEAPSLRSIDIGTVEDSVDELFADLDDLIADRSATIAELVIGLSSADPSFATLLAAVSQAGLVNTLNAAGNFTVFAPTDDAFAALPSDLLAAVLADNALLTTVLLYHVAPARLQSGEVLATETIVTIQGEEIQVDAEALQVNDSALILPLLDVKAANGIVHAIDAVLIPPSLT